MRTLILLVLLLAGTTASANCVRPGAAPAVPDGNTADEATMKVAHDTIQDYVHSLEAYRACLVKQVDEATSDTSPELKITWLGQGDAAIDAAQILANSFTVALKAFNARQAPAPKK